MSWDRSLAMEVSKPFGLNNQQSRSMGLKSVSRPVRRTGSKLPQSAFFLMCQVALSQMSRLRRRSNFILYWIVEKNLKNSLSGMIEFQGIELTLAGTDHAGNVHTEVLPNRAHESYPLFGPIGVVVGDPFRPHFIEVPKIDIRIGQICWERSKNA